MATITLYKDKLNGVGGLIDNIVKSSNSLDTQLGTLKSTLQGVSNSTYNLQDTVNSISSSSKTEKEKVSDLKKLNKQVTEFITTTVKRDNSARDEINKSKKDFYAKYNYLKPDCEKNAIEKIVDKVEKAAEWCAKHWKLVVTAVIVIVAVVLLFTGVGTGLGAAIIAGACWGAITGAVIGGVAGGINSLKNGGSFFEGFENGSFDGAIGGMIGGAITGGLAFTIGPGMSLAGSILKNAGVGALSSGSSNMVVTTIDYLIERKTLLGSLDDIAFAGLSGAITGAFVGGITGAFSYIKNSDILKNGLKIRSGKVDGKIPADEYRGIVQRSVQNPDADTMTLGKYRPSINSDGTENWEVAGPDAYTKIADNAGNTYFSLGTEWDDITNTYNLDSQGKSMFEYFNKPALDKAVESGKTIRFSHDPNGYGNCALKWEWDYLQNKHGFNNLDKIGDFWYATK